MKIFALSGSLRAASFNTKLIALAVEEARRQGADVTLGNFRELAPPLYDGDLETASGMPAPAEALVRHIEQADALMVATPEYNASVPGPLKNAFDWVSRLKPYRLQNKPVLLLGASSGVGGALKGMAALRITVTYQGALVFPEVFSVANGKTAFEATSRFADPAMQDKLARRIAEFLAVVSARPLVS